MDLQSYVTTLQQQLASAAEAGGEEARVLAGRLTAPLDAAVRLVLLEALSAAAGEISTELAPGSVDVRLRGRDPQFVVNPPPPPHLEAEGTDDPAPLPPSEPAGDAEEGGMSRFTLRMPDQLKARIEDAAAQENLSVNAWLVRSVAASLDSGGSHRQRRAPSSGRRYSGWVR
jgi:hypothetical protein